MHALILSSFWETCTAVALLISPKGGDIYKSGPSFLTMASHPPNLSAANAQFFAVVLRNTIRDNELVRSPLSIVVVYSHIYVM